MLSFSMREIGNIETVRGIYAAFGRGDLAGVLDRLEETIVWITPGSSAVPLAGRRTGRDEVRAFFEALAERLTFTVFDAREFIAQGNRVIALVHYEGRNNVTGRPFSAESAMLWTIGNGRAVRFQEYTDTEALAAAAQPSDVAVKGAR
jgi:ketosteroid isomerase-like protein